MNRKGDKMEEVFLTPLDVSLDIKKSTGTVRLYALSGRLPFIATISGRRLFRKSDVEKLKAELSERDLSE